jgi:hypothetical protein
MGDFIVTGQDKFPEGLIKDKRPISYQLSLTLSNPFYTDKGEESFHSPMV